MPIDADLFAGGFYDFVDGELYEVEGAVGCGVAHGVAEYDGARAVSNGGGVKAFDGAGIGADGVLGNVHRRESVLDGELDRFFRGALEVIDGPIFHQAADRAAAQKRRRFDGDPGALGDFHDGADVVFVSARRAIGFNLHPVRGDLAGQSFGVSESTRTGAGKTDVDGVDSQRFHEMQDFDFFLDTRVEDGRVLQAVAQGFIIQGDARTSRDLRRRGDVPVVDPIVLLHGAVPMLLERSI